MRNSRLTNIVSVTDLRTNIGRVLDQLEKNKEPLYIVSRSRPRAILVSVKLWQDKKKKQVDPFLKLRKKHGNLLSGVNVVSEIRKMRDRRWNLS